MEPNNETGKKKFFTIDKGRALPLTLTGAIIAIDQITKGIVAAKWPHYPSINVLNAESDLLWISHVRNKAIAFSLGHNVPDFLRPVLFIILPVLVLGFLFWYYLRTDEFTPVQRWAAAGILGGGLGNIIDRIFRPGGVVDFIDIKFFGIFGWPRWPTFNIADSSVVICCILLFATILFTSPKNGKKATL